MKGGTVLGGTYGDFVFANAIVSGQHWIAIAPNASGSGSTDWDWDKHLTLDGLTGELIKNVPTASTIAYSVKDGSDKLFKVYGDGKTVIGNVSAPSGYKLFVEDGILTEKVKVAESGGTAWVDYVFDSSYELPDLDSVQNYIENNGHLPDMPSEADVQTNGIDMADMFRAQQRKIEELFLYVLEQEKKISYMEAILRINAIKLNDEASKMD